MAYRFGLIVLSLAALVALGTGLYAYFTPSSGVYDVWGPLLACFAAFCIAAGGALLLGVSSRGGRLALFVLLALALAGTLLASVLLQQWIMVAALAVAVLAWLVATIAPKPARGVAA